MAYDWLPAEVEAFGKRFREIAPKGFLAIEHSIGHIPVGNGPDDWAYGGPMQNFDTILSEFDQNLHQDSCWQVAARFLGPDYRRPSDQPAEDDPTPPWYTSAGTPRGPYIARGFEWDLYRWVRGHINAQVVEDGRNYLRNLGYKVVG